MGSEASGAIRLSRLQSGPIGQPDAVIEINADAPYPSARAGRGMVWGEHASYCTIPRYTLVNLKSKL